MDGPTALVNDAVTMYARSGIGGDTEGRPPVYKAIGISLAIASGVFIGISFVLKKRGLLKANVKYNEEAGEGYGYLKNFNWWAGMTLMIVGEICNFVAYAFVDAILVTPMGALSVVVTTVLSAIFLKERLSFVGKVGCVNCIIGSVIIALNAPTQSSVASIQDMQNFVVSPGFLTYAGILIVGCTFIALWAGPRYGKKSMFVYISICSLIGGLSVVATQGLGAAVIAQIGGKPQFNQWFLYVLLVFVIATLLTEIIYLNKALNIFNAALVTPTYYVFFTSATIVTSAILFQGFKGTAISITTIIMGFLQICSGVVLLQLSKSAKDVPDAAVFTGDLDQVRHVAEQEQPESEPKADAIRGTSAIVRRISAARTKMEQDEARRYFEERRQDEIEPLNEDEVVEWDGLRRRKTTLGSSRSRSRVTLHPPLGMSRFPDESEMGPDRRPSTRESGGTHSFLGGIRSRASSVLHPTQWRSGQNSARSPVHPVAMSEIAIPPPHEVDEFDDKRPYASGGLQEPFTPGGRERSDTPRSIAWADDIGSKTDLSQKSPVRPSYLHQEQHLTPPEPPPHSGGQRRQFSFQNVFNRGRSTSSISNPRSGSANGGGGGFFGSRGLGSRQGDTPEQRRAMKDATEEERLGLVEGDSQILDADGYRRHRRSSTSSSSTTAFPDYHDSMKAGQQPRQGSSRGRGEKDDEKKKTSSSHHSSRRQSPPDNDTNTKELEAGWQELSHPRPSGTTPTRNQPTPPKKLPPIPTVEEPEEDLNMRPAPLDTSNNSSYTRVELRSPDTDVEGDMQAEMERRRRQQEIQQRQRRLRRKRMSKDDGSPSKDSSRSRGGDSGGEDRRRDQGGGEGEGGGSFL
ncbi:hypothetical protein FQN54_000877 [Arachnomyces sp. PD_36]|nr:hypothetical protein FQN54_000877 [Arachnomyces sp. PD_36]